MLRNPCGKAEIDDYRTPQRVGGTVVYKCAHCRDQHRLLFPRAGVSFDTTCCYIDGPGVALDCPFCHYDWFKRTDWKMAGVNPAEAARFMDAFEAMIARQRTNPPRFRGSEIKAAVAKVGIAFAGRSKQLKGYGVPGEGAPAATEPRP